MDVSAEQIILTCIWLDIHVQIFAKSVVGWCKTNLYWESIRK